MISLISQWQLKNGCPRVLEERLKTLAEEVQRHEADTIAYSVHLLARAPSLQEAVPGQGQSHAVPGDQQSQVVFYEAYRDAKAFNEHLKGHTFTVFREETLAHFYEDPERPGWPLATTIFLQRESAFFRPHR